MEKNEIIIEEDNEIKTFKKNELLLYKYFKYENKDKIKSDLNYEISHLKKIEDSSPKINENKEKQLNDEIQDFFKNKNSKNNKTLYTIDDLQDEKIILEKDIKEKKEAKELLKNLKIV